MGSTTWVVFDYTVGQEHFWAWNKVDAGGPGFIDTFYTGPNGYSLREEPGDPPERLSKVLFVVTVPDKEPSDREAARRGLPLDLIRIEDA